MEGPMASCTPIKPRESRRQTYGRVYVVDGAFAIQIRGGAETYFVALHKRHTNERSRRRATDDRTGPDRTVAEIDLDSADAWHAPLSTTIE